MKAHLILYVSDQEASRRFYALLLAQPPQLDAPGMTEFRLNEQTVLGLMPVAAIKRLLSPALPDPAAAAGIPRAELYLVTEDPDGYQQRALANGATELSPLAWRDWGDQVAYSLDPDGHVLAFARSRPQ
jgi:uncharacterized protein